MTEDVPTSTHRPCTCQAARRLAALVEEVDTIERGGGTVVRIEVVRWFLRVSGVTR
jgi:hypothetical protein